MNYQHIFSLHIHSEYVEYVMQSLAHCNNNVVKITQNLAKNTPHPKDIGTSQGGLRKFVPEYPSCTQYWNYS